MANVGILINGGSIRFLNEFEMEKFYSVASYEQLKMMFYYPLHFKFPMAILVLGQGRKNGNKHVFWVY